MRINVQLIDAATDNHLWGEVYDRQLSVENVFAIQAEIALAIANALEATLSPQVRKLIAKIPTANLETYDNYLMARQLFNRGNNDNLKDARSRLDKVIEQDPAFVEAYVLLAGVYRALIGKGAATPQALKQPFEDAVQTALLLDANNAGAHAAYAEFLWVYGMDGVGESFDRALQIEPANVDIMAMYATWLRHEFHFDQALQLYQSAREMDPLSIQVLFGMARIYETRRETEKALYFYSKISQIDPSSVMGADVAGVYSNAGDLVRVIESLMVTLEMDPEDSDISNFIALGFVDFGDLETARQWVPSIETSKSINPLSLAVAAILNVYQDNLDQAILSVREILDNQMPDRWGSDAIVTRILLIWASNTGRADVALGSTRIMNPELFEPTPRINPGNVLQAIDIANLLQMQGQNNLAEKLLLAAVSAFEGPYPIPQTLTGPARAQALALRGDRQGAIEELRKQVNEGWRFQWRWHTELNPNFKLLLDEPEFQAIVEFLRSDLARQYEEFRALQASGEIPSGVFQQSTPLQ